MPTKSSSTERRRGSQRNVATTPSGSSRSWLATTNDADDEPAGLHGDLFDAPDRVRSACSGDLHDLYLMAAEG